MQAGAGSHGSWLRRIFLACGHLQIPKCRMKSNSLTQWHVPVGMTKQSYLGFYVLPVLLAC